MRLWAGILIALLMACSSAESEEQAPADLISMDSFSEIMVDVQLLEATFNQKFWREDDPNRKKAEFYQQIFEKHGVSKEHFELSYEYYSQRPEEMMLVYEYVINELSQREEKISTSITDAQQNDRSPAQSEQ